MNRIDSIFKSLRERGGKALMPFITVGDPDLATTAALLPVLEEAGASICELGIPFSDPVADGPVIQASMARALDKGLHIDQVFEMVRTLRPKLKMGLVAMVSYSIVYRRDPKNFLAQAKAAGFDGLIVPDVPLEESRELKQLADDAGLTLSLLVSPATPIERARQIAQGCSGFVYVLARAGITGERKELPQELPARIQALRQVTDLPMVVGFGVSSGEHVRQVCQVADAAIVGSALMRRIDEHRDAPKEELIAQVRAFATDLAQGLKTTPQQK